jgi:formylglycine-generating enzyme required for sulfatase activity
MLTPFRLYSLLAILGSIPLAGSAAERVALVIGVNQYENLPGNAQLRVAVSDAELMASSLEALDPPFRVTLLTDVKQDVADEKYDDFLREAAGAECALLYFAGHGIEFHGANYLLVKDTAISEISADVELMKRRLGREALSLQAMVDSLDLTGAQVKLVVLDCCRDNPLTATVPGGSRSVVGGQSGLAQVAAPSGTLISYSADAGQKANDGLFTAVLAENLKKPGLTAVQVFATTRDQVREISTAWAAEDAKKGLDPDFRRVRHEPAEYTKLNLAGTNFTFTRGPAVAGKVEDAGTSAEMAALKAQLAAEKQAREEAERKAAAMSTTPVPVTTGGFAASRGIVKGLGFKSVVDTSFVWVEPGTFTMGSSRSEQVAMTTPEAGGKIENYQDEPGHSVTISSGYWVGSHEVTIGDYLRFLNESGKWDDAWVALDDETWSPIEKYGSSYRMRSSKGATWGDESLPMVMVSWDGAVAYCKWLNEQEASRLPAGYRFALPSEAEWEKAARGGTTTMTYAGDLKILALNNAPLLDSIAWYGGNSGLDHSSGFDSSTWEGKQYAHKSAGTHPVGLKSPNEFGAYDMIGNVWEWCGDWYDEDYYKDGQTDPTGATTGSSRVARGGSWGNGAQDCRAAYRFRLAPGYRSDLLGFRPALSSLPAR